MATVGMHKYLHTSNRSSSNLMLRHKRDFATRSAACKGMKAADGATQTLTKSANKVKKLPVVGSVLSTITRGFATMTTFLFGGTDSASSALGCDKSHFEGVKQVMEETFNNIDRKLSENSMAMSKILALVEKTLDKIDVTRYEMKVGFERILDSMKHDKIKAIVHKIDNFVKYFEEERIRLKSLPNDEYVFKLEEPENILTFLKSSRTPGGDGLQSSLYDLLNEDNNYCIPENINDSKSFQALYAMFYATQAYTSVMFFLLEQFSYLANFYFIQGNFSEYNKQFHMIRGTFTDFKFSLTGNLNNNPILEKAIKVLTIVVSKPFVKNTDKEKEFASKIESLKKIESQIKEMQLPLIPEVPRSVFKVYFEPPVIKTPYGDWEDQSRVRYAVQLRDNEQYSEISTWTRPLKINGLANPTLKLQVDDGQRDKLIYRQFNTEQPELAGILEGSQSEFRDIDRDLYNAAGSQHYDISVVDATKLITLGAKINAVFEFRRSAIHAAAMSGNNQVLSKLISHPDFLNIDQKDSKGYTPFYLAAKHGQSNTLNMLALHGADVNVHADDQNMTPLHIAAKSGFVETVTTLTTLKGIKINEKDNTGLTALHYGILGGMPVVKFLVSLSDIEVDVKSEAGITPFHLAVMNKFLKTSEMLFSTGKININSQDNHGLTALHFSAMVGSVKLIKYLMSLDGIDVNIISNEDNWSSLHFAIYFERKASALELLKSDRINVNVSTKSGHTPLHFAVARDENGVTKELLNKKSNLETVTKNGYTPLHIASMLEKPTICITLLKEGANIEAKSRDGSTPLFIAVKFNNANIVKYLIEKSADVNVKMPNGSTPILHAVVSSTTEIVTLLLDGGADVHVKDTDGHTPIQLAILYYKVACVKKLLAIDKELKNENGAEYKSLIDFTTAVVKRDILNYLATTKDPKKITLDTVLKEFESEGKLDTYRAVFNMPNISIIFHFYFLEMKQCLSGLQAKNKVGVDECVPNILRRPRRTPNEDRIFKVSNKTKPSKPEIFFGNYDKKISSSTIRNTFSSDNNRVSLIRSEDTNGLLFLLNFLIRNFTREKYPGNSQSSSPTLETKLKALELTEKMESLIDSVSSVPAKEAFDLTEVYSSIYKAIVNGNTILPILCHYIKQLPTAEAQQAIQVANHFLRVNLAVANSETCE